MSKKKKYSGKYFREYHIDIEVYDLMDIIMSKLIVMTKCGEKFLTYISRGYGDSEEERSIWKSNSRDINNNKIIFESLCEKDLINKIKEEAEKYFRNKGIGVNTSKKKEYNGKELIDVRTIDLKPIDDSELVIFTNCGEEFYAIIGNSGNDGTWHGVCRNSNHNKVSFYFLDRKMLISYLEREAEKYFNSKRSNFSMIMRKKDDRKESGVFFKFIKKVKIIVKRCSFKKLKDWIMNLLGHKSKSVEETRFIDGGQVINVESDTKKKDVEKKFVKKSDVDKKDVEKSVNDQHHRRRISNRRSIKKGNFVQKGTKGPIGE